MGKLSDKLKEEYPIEANQTYDTNQAYNEIKEEEFYEIANLLKDSPNNKDLIAFYDPKIRKLVNFILSTITIENDRINSPRTTYPLQIIGRYKSYDSIKEKLDDYNSRGEEDKPITDLLAVKIIPAEEHSIFTANGDLKLKSMIKQREETRKFLVDKNITFDNNPIMTFETYVEQCNEIINKLEEIFIELREDKHEDYATERIDYYESLKSTLLSDLEQVNNFGRNGELELEDILQMTNVKYDELLHELENNYHNHITMYQLKSAVTNIFENSDLLKRTRNLYIQRFKQNKRKKNS